MLFLEDRVESIEVGVKVYVIIFVVLLEEDLVVRTTLRDKYFDV